MRNAAWKRGGQRRCRRFGDGERGTVSFRFDGLAIRAPLRHMDSAHGCHCSLADGFRADLVRSKTDIAIMSCPGARDETA